MEPNSVTIWRGDCLNVLNNLEKESIDLIACDPPYGITACKWDSVIPLDDMWRCFEYVLKPSGTVVLTASQPFTSRLVLSNIEWFKYELICKKSNATGFLDCKFRPLKSHENILVFSKAGCSNGSNPAMTYNPQKTIEKPYVTKRKNTVLEKGSVARSPVQRTDTINNGTRYPRSVIDFKSERGLHKTQKPVSLFEYIVRTYSNENETVLDATMGSGTTAISCMNSNRNCIGVEKDEEMAKQAYDRCLKHGSKNFSVIYKDEND